MSTTAATQPSEQGTLLERFRSLVFPGALILLGEFYFLRTWIRHPLLLFTDFETFKHKSFSMCWAAFGETMSQEMPAGTGEALGSVSGVALDVGPGSGTQLHFYHPTNITKMYAVEPAVDMHKDLLENAKKNGFKEGQYEIISAGAEPQSLIPAMAKMGILTSSERGNQPIFDSISCCRVLCGVPNHTGTIDGLYKLLKPGGRIVFCEHVVNPYPNGGSLLARVMQKVYMLCGWWFWMGGCNLDRDTEKVLNDVARQDGGWKSLKVNKIGTWSTLPHIIGYAQKK